MACACKKRRTSKYKWTSADGSESVVYDSEIQAKAKTIRFGGTYKTIPA